MMEETSQTSQTSSRNGQKSPYGYRETFGYSKKFPAYTFSKPYRKTSVPAYPSVTDELRSDLQILKASLEIKNNYMKDLRESRDSLISKLNVKDIRIEDFEKRVKRYQEFFYKKRAGEKEKPEIEGPVKQAATRNIYGETEYSGNKYSDQKNYS